jgi:hypothetical protein
MLLFTKCNFKRDRQKAVSADKGRSGERQMAAVTSQARNVPSELNISNLINVTKTKEKM